jgi:GTPase SAR1 family protein
MIASPSVDGSIRLWNPYSGDLIWTTSDEHLGSVYCVAWSSDGQTLASGYRNGTICLWNAKTGELLGKLEGHTDRVFCVSWLPHKAILASGSADRGIRLWDAETRRQILSHSAHDSGVNDLAWSSDGRRLASASYDQHTRMWNAEGMRLHWNRLIWDKHGHAGGVSSLAWSPDGLMLATGSNDKTIEIRNPDPGNRQVVLEGHTGIVTGVTFSADSKLLASKSQDGTVRLWHCNNWEIAAILEEPNSDWWAAGLAFHPQTMTLATLGEQDTVIRIWDLASGVDQETATAVPPSVHHITGKIVLVGDSGVGKTGLGWRLTHGEFKEHFSTHGQQFWVFRQLSGRRSDGTVCEAILWDFAGQPDYRLIHALFLDEADLALVLFDSTDRSDPLHGVEYWLRQLKVGVPALGGNAPGRAIAKGGTPTILVAARCDRGAPTLTGVDLEAFCRQRGLSVCISTSATRGDGLEDLIQLMKALIPWDEKPATVTTTTFKRIKDYVLEWKENRAGQQVIVSPRELRLRLEQTDVSWCFTDPEMMTAVGHLENYGYVKKLITSKGEMRLLLAPDLFKNLVSSFVLEARRNEKGLGALEERRLLAGEYRFPELDGLTPDERNVLLDAATLLFIEHNICFRETDPLSVEPFLVFPELINLNKPAADDGKPVEDGAAYAVSGAIENVYASLVVLLGYTEKFTRTDQWRNHARYEVGNRMVCGFRQVEHDDELEFVLYFGTEVGRPVRQLFQALFESFLARRNLTVTRYEPVFCTKCWHPLERVVVRERLRGKKDFTFCPACGERLPLPKMDEPIQLTREQQVDVEAQRRTADMRTPFEKEVFRVQAYVNAKGIKPPECFISYAWGDPEQERWVEKNLAPDLQKAGIAVVLDRWENVKIGASVVRFVERVGTCDRVVVVGTPLYLQKYENGNPMRGFVVAAESDLIGKRMIGTEAEKQSVLPVLLVGSEEKSFPPLLRGRVYADFRDEHAYFKTAFDLILSLYDIRPNDFAALLEGRMEPLAPLH